MPTVYQFFIGFFEQEVWQPEFDVKKYSEPLHPRTPKNSNFISCFGTCNPANNLRHFGNTLVFAFGTPLEVLIRKENALSLCTQESNICNFISCFYNWILVSFFYIWQEKKKPKQDFPFCSLCTASGKKRRNRNPFFKSRNLTTKTLQEKDEGSKH